MRVIGAQGLKLADAAAFRHRHHVLSGLAVLAVPADRRYRARPADDLHPAGIFQPASSASIPVWPRFDPERALALFALTMGDPARAEALRAPPDADPTATIAAPAAARSGSIVSSLIEIVLSALLAPILMLIQSGSVFQILLGRDTGWQPQRRDDGSIPFARHRAPSPLAHGPRRARRHLRLHDRHVAVPLDVADDRRPAAGDPALLAQRPARRRVWP